MLLPLFSFTRASHVGTDARTYAGVSSRAGVSPRAAVSLGSLFAPATASAASADNLNFQARLQSAGGSIVPDGYYNIEFKLYSASSGGSALWTETYAYNSGSGTCNGPLGVNDCRVRVVNGYVSVYLGSLTSFPGTIPWDQQLYVTMNVDQNGTTSSGAITYDGEMTPRLKLTAVPYAMRANSANQLQTTSGVNTATLSILAPTSGNQIFQIQDQGAAGTYNILTAPNGTDGYIKLQTNTPGTQQTGNFNINGTGIADILQGATKVLTPTIDTATAVALNIGTTNATSINLNQNTTLAAGKSITVTGGNTASRPASPTEGMVYFDTTTKQLLTYANGKWKADGSEAILVAASDSSAADKAAANYLADGNTAAAGDGDQVEINAALTAAAGKKVLLLAGTYTIDASISVPNNTTLAGVGAGSLITIPNSFNTSINAITNTTTGGSGTGITVQDLKLDGNKANQASGNMSGIYLNGVGFGSSVAGAKVMNVIANNWRGNGAAIVLTTTYNTTVIGNTLQGNSNYGIYLSTTSNHNTITGNTITGTTIDGIYLSSSSGNTVTNNMVSGGTYIIYLASSTNNTITGNMATGGTYGIYLATTSNNNTITGNTAQGNNFGIYLSSSAINTITGNTVQGNYNTGIYLTSSSNNDITGNTVQGTSTPGLYGIYLSSSSNNALNGNRLDTNGNTTNNNAIYLTASDGNTITGNDITDDSATSTNYAINILNSTSDANYLADNTLGGGTINDAGTGTIYGGQLNSSNNYVIQPAGTIELQKNTNITGTISGTSSLTLGTSSSTNGTIVFKNSTNANTVTLQSAAQTGNYTLSIPILTANDTICLQGVANCSGSGASTVGALDGGTANANGATISSSTLYLQSASASYAGLVNTTTQTFAGDKTFNGNTTLAAGKTITLTGGNTASRPASPTEGMVYFDTTTKQLLTYANGKWQADRTTATKIVAASNSSQSDKDAADYIATGTSDQTIINTALTAASGGKVYLMEGTYTVDGSISVPNNTTLAGAGLSTIITVPGGLNSNINAITNATVAGGTGVDIQDLKLDGANTSQASGVMNGIYIDGAGSGTGSTAVQGVKIANVWSNSWRGNGIVLNSSLHSTVINSMAKGNFGAGIDVESSSKNTIENNIVQGNNNGIYVNASSDITISGNIAAENIYGLRTLSASNNTFSSNIARGNTSYGVYFNSSTGSTFNGNNVQSNSQSGIFLWNSQRNTFTANTIQQNSGAGIELQGTSAYNTVSANNFSDNGGTTVNNAFNIASTGYNTITSNTITDSSATTNNYAINLISGTANYLADNTLGGGTIVDGGTGTIYGGQVNDAGNYVIQPAGTIELMKNTNVTGTISGTSSLTLGTSSSVDGTIVFKNSTNANTVTLQSAAQASGSYTLSIPSLTANADICTTLGNCSTAAGSNYYIQNQNSAAQTSSNFWISATGRANTSFLAPTFDIASAGTLAIGNANATTINIGSNVATHAINIGTGAAAQTVTVGSLDTTSSTLIHGGTGGIALTTGSSSGNVAVDVGGVNKFNITASTISANNDIYAFNDTAGNLLLGLDEGTGIIRTPWNKTFNAQGAAVFDNGFTVSATTTNPTYVTPSGSSIQTKGNFSNQTLAGYSTILAMGITDTSSTNARGIVIADARTSTHQATIGILSPDENQIFGLSWDGSNTTARFKNSANSVALQGGGVDLVTTTKSGTDAITTLGVAGTNAGNLVFATSANTNTITLFSATQTASRTVTIPALGANDTLCLVTLANCAATGGSFIQNTTSLQSSSNFYISGSGKATTSFLTPLVDTISGTALDIGTTNATVINLNENTTVASGKTFAVNGGATVTTTSASAFVIQNASSSVLFTADTSAMQVVFGTTTNGVIVSSSGIQLKGTARDTKNILFTPEYSGAVLDALSDAACSSNYNGTMTSGYSSASRTNYYNWQSSSGTAQCFDVVVQVPIPSDFDTWSGTPDIEMKGDSTGTSAYAIQIIPSSGTDANYGSYVSPGTMGTSWANMATSSLSGTYTAGDYMTIKVRLSSTSSANVQLGNIKLTYKAKF